MTSFITPSPENDSYDDAIKHHRRKQYEKAWPIFRRLASEGHGIATYYMAYYYHYGHVVKEDKSKALIYYRKSADLGCRDAEYSYAVLCLADASEYMEKAAKHGYVKAGIKFVELQLSRISWLLAKKTDSSKLLEYLRNEESLIANYETKTKNELEKKIDKLRKIIQTSTEL